MIEPHTYTALHALANGRACSLKLYILGVSAFTHRRSGACLRLGPPGSRCQSFGCENLVISNGSGNWRRWRPRAYNFSSFNALWGDFDESKNTDTSKTNLPQIPTTIPYIYGKW